MSVIPKGKKRCSRCHATINATNFYTSNNDSHFDEINEKNLYPKCKGCATSIVNPYEPSTFLPLLQDLDVLYDDDLWNSAIQKKADPNTGIATGIKVVGVYLGAVKLGQYKGLRWADSAERGKEKAKREAIAQAQAEQHRLRFAEALGTGASAQLAEIDRDLLTDEEISHIFEGSKPTQSSLIDGAESRAQLSVGNLQGEHDGPRGTLSPEDARYLSEKWGAIYIEEELLFMERLYHEMTLSFEITTASHVDYLKKICKASHKMEQSLDVNDIESYNKIARVYDTLMKSAKFTAAQNKLDASAQEESLARAILLAEEHGAIPMVDIEVARDEIDFVLQDLMRYTRKLVTEEAGLGNLIENAVAAMKRQEEEVDEELSPLEEAEAEILTKPATHSGYSELIDEREEYEHEVY